MDHHHFCGGLKQTNHSQAFYTKYIQNPLNTPISLLRIYTGKKSNIHLKWLVDIRNGSVGWLSVCLPGWLTAWLNFWLGWMTSKYGVESYMALDNIFLFELWRIVFFLVVWEAFTFNRHYLVDKFYYLLIVLLVNFIAW